MIFAVCHGRAVDRHRAGHCRSYAGRVVVLTEQHLLHAVLALRAARDVPRAGQRALRVRCLGDASVVGRRVVEIVELGRGVGFDEVDVDERRDDRRPAMTRRRSPPPTHHTTCVISDGALAVTVAGRSLGVGWEAGGAFTALLWRFLLGSDAGPNSVADPGRHDRYEPPGRRLVPDRRRPTWRPDRRRRGARLQRGARARAEHRAAARLPDAPASRSRGASRSSTTRRPTAPGSSRDAGSHASCRTCARLHLDRKGRGLALRTAWTRERRRGRRVHGRRPLDRPRRAPPARRAARVRATPTSRSARGSRPASSVARGAEARGHLAHATT